MNVLDHDLLENTLLTGWSRFLDTARLLGFVLERVKEHGDFLPVESPPPVRSIRVTISRFRWEREGRFEVWLDFTVPDDHGVVVGTCEALLLPGGDLLHLRTTGVLFLQ